MFSQIGSTEVIVVALVLFFLFGAKKLPEFVKGIGEAIKEFRKTSKS